MKTLRLKKSVTCKLSDCTGYTLGLYRVQCLIISVFFAYSGQAEESNRAAFPPSITTFVERYCIDCHDDLVSKGDRDFLPFLDDPTAVIHHHTLEEILEQLNLGEMPPQKKGVDQPDQNLRRQTTGEITRYLTKVETSLSPRETLMRRLTKHEYENTMRDLLGISPDIVNASNSFPDDSNLHGFTNLGEIQSLSDSQLEAWMDAANAWLDAALFFDKPGTESKLEKFTPSNFTNRGTANQKKLLQKVLAKDKSYVDICEGQLDKRTTRPKDAWSENGGLARGTYRISIKASAVGRIGHGYPNSIMVKCGLDLEKPLELGLWYSGGPDDNGLGAGKPGHHLVKVFQLKDDMPEVYTATVDLPEGAFPLIGWMNGPNRARGYYKKIFAEHNPADLKKTSPGYIYRGPRVRLFGLSVEGPIHDQWPPVSHRKLVGDTLDANKIDIPKTIQKFACRAFRRPVAMSEIAHYINYIEALTREGVSRSEAIKSGFSAILTSPHFLYLNEGDSGKGKGLNDFQIATRLSYFLWGSMPDDRLFTLASRGTLSEPNSISQETGRMLADPRARSFFTQFPRTWLRLDKLGTMPPGGNQFSFYTLGLLESAMRTETRLLFQHIFNENRPITEFINADYTFVNDKLAKHYGIQGVDGLQFRKVALPESLRRRGLLGHGSILTASANGVDTSPVTRGVWVLESLLGTPPSPPPPDVPPIEPDTRGATTIREQLEKHRSVSACADCHAKIDPWGFALEFYDPIGGLRTRYPGGGKAKPIDGSSVLQSGTRLKDESDLNKEILNRRRLFAKNLTKKLMTYAIGREPGFRDQAEIDRIADLSLLPQKGFQDLMREVVLSPLFTAY